MRQWLLLFNLTLSHQLRLLIGNPLKDITGRLIAGILRYQFAHHGQFQQGLLEGVDAGFGGE
ncbi:hypothetical protein D3C86_2240590 [compost metagenome]